MSSHSSSRCSIGSRASIPAAAASKAAPSAFPAGWLPRVVPGLDGDEVRLERRLDLPPVSTDPSDRWVVDLFDMMEPLIGERPELRGLAYFTDACALTSAYRTPPTVICGPGGADQAHQTDESCPVELLDAAADAFFEIARRWCRL